MDTDLALTYLQTVAQAIAHPSVKPPDVPALLAKHDELVGQLRHRYRHNEQLSEQLSNLHVLFRNSVEIEEVNAEQ